MMEEIIVYTILQVTSDGDRADVEIVVSKESYDEAVEYAISAITDLAYNENVDSYIILNEKDIDPMVTVSGDIKQIYGLYDDGSGTLIYILQTVVAISKKHKRDERVIAQRGFVPTAGLKQMKL